MRNRINRRAFLALLVAVPFVTSAKPSARQYLHASDSCRQLVSWTALDELIASGYVVAWDASAR